MDDYKDIIDIDRPKSNREKMSLYDRAAQFAPFAALKGYEEKISEKGRITSKKIELSQYDLEMLNNKIMMLCNNPNSLIEITYFIKDSKKDGGEYITIENIVKKIDIDNRIVVLKNEKIPFDDILNIKSDLFNF